MGLLDRITAAVSNKDEAAALSSEVRRLEEALRATHEAQRSREELLRVVVDATPMAMVVLSDRGTIAFTNAAAREMFFEGREVAGQNFLGMLAGVSEALRRALLSEVDHIFTFDDGGGLETYHLSRRELTLGASPHTLVTVRNMTVEISRQENTVLKKTIRIMGHELANTLGPVTSLLQTGREMLGRPELHGRLATMFATIDERLNHLSSFLRGWAQLGQLPKPRCQEVAWPGFLEGLRSMWPDLAIGAPPTRPGWFDPAQIQQVVINLVKNAREAGGPPDAVSVEVEIDAEGLGTRISVLDRGAGMTDEVMHSALLPSFTTKENGSGMGLPLCREIVEAHLGRLRIARRPGGGTVVWCWLPPRELPPTLASLSRAKLTLSRG
jgi:signal transduction histidine kinase